jgi:hypothetical protein
MAPLVSEGAILEQEVVSALAFAAARVGLEDREILPTIKSGLAAGKPRPASVAAQPAGKPPRQVPAYVPFPLEALPCVLCAYVGCAAQALGCDPALVALPALAVAAGCVGNSCAIRLKRNWTEPAIVWAITVAPSGQLKSPAWAQAVQPLAGLQIDLLDAYQAERAVYERALEDWKAQPKNERGEKPALPDEPVYYLTGDVTIEKIGQMLAANPRGLLLARDELDGWFQSFTRYKSRGTDRPQWLELHRAGTLRIDRLSKERGMLSVRRACCSVAGTIQPAIYSRVLDEEALAAGLGARFLCAMPPPRKRRWTEADVDEELAKRYEDLLRGMLAIELANVSKREPHLHDFDPAARKLWVEWFNEWSADIELAEGEQAAALCKLEAYSARLALIHHVVSLVDSGSMALRPVGEASLSAGITLTRWFANESSRLASILKESAEERDRRRLVEWIQSRGGEASARDLMWANRRRWPTSEAATADLQSLVGLGLGEWMRLPSPATGRPPAPVFRILASHESQNPQNLGADVDACAIS